LRTIQFLSDSRGASTVDLRATPGLRDTLRLRSAGSKRFAHEAEASCAPLGMTPWQKGEEDAAGAAGNSN